MSGLTVPSQIKYSTLHQVQQQQQADNTKNRSLLNIFISYVKKSEGAKAVTEATSYVGYWLNLKKLSHATENAKNFISILETPASVLNFLDRFRRAQADGKLKSSGKMIQAGAGVVNNVYDGLEFLQAQKLARFPENLKYVNSAATLAGAGIGTVTNLNELSQLNGKDEMTKRLQAPRVNLTLIRLAQNVSYTALGTFGLSTLFGFAVASWIPVALATSGIFFTITGSFYQKAKHI